MNELCLYASINTGDAHYSAYLQHLESEQKEVAAFKASSDLQLKNMQQCYDGIRPQHYQMRQTVEEIKASVSESSTEIVATTTSTVQNGCNAGMYVRMCLHSEPTYFYYIFS